MIDVITSLGSTFVIHQTILVLLIRKGTIRVFRSDCFDLAPFINSIPVHRKYRYRVRQQNKNKNLCYLVR